MKLYISTLHYVSILLATVNVSTGNKYVRQVKTISSSKEHLQYVVSGQRRKLNLEHYGSTVSARNLQILRYIPMKLSISVTTTQSGEIDYHELDTILDRHLLTYLQQSLSDFPINDVEMNVSPDIEPVRLLEAAEKLRQYKFHASGYAFFPGDSLPTTENLNRLISLAFEGKWEAEFLSSLGNADDPILRSSTHVWSGSSSSSVHEEYLPADVSDPSNKVTVVLLSVAAGVALVALFIGHRVIRRQKSTEVKDTASLTEIPWMTLPPLKGAKSTTNTKSFDQESCIEPPIEVIVGDTTSVHLFVGDQSFEKIALSGNMSQRIEEENLHEKEISEEKKVNSLKELYDTLVEKDAALTSLPDSHTIHPRSFKNSGQDLTKLVTSKVTQRSDPIQRSSDEQSKKSSSTSESKRRSLFSKVSFPKWMSKDQSLHHERSNKLYAITEEEDVSIANDDESKGMSKTSNELKGEDISDCILSIDPSGDVNTNVLHQDFEDTSFQCELIPQCISTLTDSLGGDDDDEDWLITYTSDHQTVYTPDQKSVSSKEQISVKTAEHVSVNSPDNISANTPDHMSVYTQEQMSHYTQETSTCSQDNATVQTQEHSVDSQGHSLYTQEQMSQYTNRSTNASLSTNSFSSESNSTISYY